MKDHKLRGFMTALFLAVVSYFVIAFFCPEFSERVLGVSMRKASASETQKERKTQDTLTEIVDISTLLKK